MKKLLIFILVLGFAGTVHAGLFDKIKDAAKDAVGQSAPVQKVQPATEPEVKQETPKKTEAIEQKTDVPAVSSQPTQPAEAQPVRIPGISPDQQDANDCSNYTYADYRKSEDALKKTNLKRGSARYLPKNEWIEYLKGRYPNMHQAPGGYSYSFGKWFGISCAHITLTCPKGEPGCTINTSRCYDFASKKGIKTCPINVCEPNDTKCIEKYKIVK